jgi:hypothetical protein
MSKQPWDRIRGESKEAYIRFLIYRNLGSVRTLDNAYRMFLGGIEGNERERAGGVWHNDSTNWSWVSRAHEWDVAMMTMHGERAVIAIAETLELIAVNALEGAAKYKPECLADVVELIKLLGGYVSNETVERVRSRRLVDARTVEPKRIGHNRAGEQAD